MSIRLTFSGADWAKFGRIALALAIGLAGAQAFSIWNLPLPWLLGSIAFCLAAAFLRVPLQGPAKAVPVMRVILGVAVGGAFTSELLGRAGEMIGSLLFVAPCALAIALAGFWYFRAVGKLDLATATYAAIPGGFQDMLALGRDAGADERKLTLIHATRIVALVFVLPFGFYWLSAVEAGARSSGYVSIFEQPVDQLAVLAVCGAFGWWLAVKLRLSGAAVIGPMMVSSAVHLAGWTDARPPVELINLAQLIIGCQAGCQFVGITVKEFVHTILLSFGFVVFALLIAGTGAVGVTLMTGFDPSAALLAFSPGGQAEMILIAVGLGIDPAYVALHHLMRMVIVITLAPVLYRWLRKWRRAD